MFQGLEAVKELPVMLLVMMLAFFRADPPSNVSLNSSSQSSSAFGNTTNNSSKTKSSGQSKKPRMVLQQPEKVMRIHDYYMHKLQVRSFKRHGWFWNPYVPSIDRNIRYLYYYFLKIYLKLRYPSSAVGGALHSIISAIDKVIKSYKNHCVVIYNCFNHNILAKSNN